MVRKANPFAIKRYSTQFFRAIKTTTATAFNLLAFPDWQLPQLLLYTYGKDRVAVAKLLHKKFLYTLFTF
ncbi:hypothetical protein D3C83_248420 [compost metagenome]